MCLIICIQGARGKGFVPGSRRLVRVVGDDEIEYDRLPAEDPGERYVAGASRPKVTGLGLRSTTWRPESKSRGRPRCPNFRLRTPTAPSTPASSPSPPLLWQEDSRSRSRRRNLRYAN